MARKRFERGKEAFAEVVFPAPVFRSLKGDGIWSERQYPFSVVALQTICRRGDG